MDFNNAENNLSPELKHRWENLLEKLRNCGSVIVAFSGGVDSGLLCAATYSALGKKMLAITIRSPIESPGDVASAEKLAAQIGFPFRVVEYDDLVDPLFVSNPPDRCYVCKLARFQALKIIAVEDGYDVLVEGSNADDLNDYRPGRQAVDETGSISPLQESGFTKKEIRALAKALGLSIWDRPSAPCLATRFPYGSPITKKGLRQVAEGEQFLQEHGFHEVRVRHHGQLARIEVVSEEIQHLIELRQQVSDYFRTLGFHYTAADLSGYRLGSLNEVLK